MNLDILSKQELFDGGNLIMLVGPPGSGKTTLAEKIKNDYMNFEIVCPDDIRQELTGDASDQTHNTEVFSKVYSRIAFFLKEGINVIYDATNCRPAYRYKILDIVDGNAKKVICIVLTNSIGECLKRNIERNERQVPEHVIESMYFTLRKHPPTIFEGYDMIIRA